LLKKAEKSFATKDYKEARSFFAQAYKLSPEKLIDAPFAPRKDILSRLASCVDLLDDQYYVSTVQPMERSVKICPRGAGKGGFEKCTKCNGTGEVVQKTSLRSRLVMKVQCDRCGGYQWTFCEDCRGLEFTTSLTPKERKTLYEVIDKVRRFKVL